MLRISEEDEEEKERVSLNDIKHDIKNITKKIEVLDKFYKSAAVDVLQECTDHLRRQVGCDAIPQIDGSFDLVIFCEFCNKEFIGDKRVRDSQTHQINVHLKNRFQEITPMKSENYFMCSKSECEFKTTKKLDFWRHMGGKHGLIKLFIKQHFEQNPPLIPANGHYDGEDEETDHNDPREEQGTLHTNTSTITSTITSSLGPESESYDNSAPCINTNFSASSMSKPGPRPMAVFPLLTEYSEENETSAYSRTPPPGHQMGQRPMFPASHSTSVLSGPPSLSAEAAPGLALLRYKLTSLPSVPSLQRDTSLVSIASGQTGLSHHVSIQPQEADMRSVRSNMNDPAFSHGPSHTPTPGHFGHQNSLHSYQPQVTPGYHPSSLSQHRQPQPIVRPRAPSSVTSSPPTWLSTTRLRPTRQSNKTTMTTISDIGEVCLEIIKNKQGQDHEMVNFQLPPGQEDVRKPALNKMEVSRGEDERLSGSGQSSYTGGNEQNNIDQSKRTRVIIQNEIGAGALDIPSSSTTKCQDPGLQPDSSISVSVMESQRQEEENAVASILENSFIEEAESHVNDIINIEEKANNYDIKFNLPNDASYLIYKAKVCGQKLGDIISLLFRRRSQKLSSFEAFSSGTKPLDLSEDCSTLNCREIWVYQRVLFKLQILDKVTLEVKAMETEVTEEVLSNIVLKHGLTLADFEVSVSRYGGHLESVDLRESVTTIDNTMVVIKRMTAAADETQELVHGDECLEPPPRSSTPVPGHNEDISDLFHNATDILLREHSYSRGWSVSSSDPPTSRESVKSVSGYHSLSLSEMERAEADQRQVRSTTTSRLGLSGYTASVSASCPTNQSLSPQMDTANQMPISFGGGDREIRTKEEATPVENETAEEHSLTSASSEVEVKRKKVLAKQGTATVINHDHDKLDDRGPYEKIPDDDEEDAGIEGEVIPVTSATAIANFVFSSSILTPDGQQSQTSPVKFTGRGLSLPQSLRTKWTKTVSSKKVPLVKIKTASRKIMKPEKPKRKVYSKEELELASSILHSSRRVFNLLRTRKIIHLPHPSTIYRHLQNFKCPPGLTPQVFRLFRLFLSELEPEDRICVLLEDEMKLESRISWCPRLQRLFPAHKNAQVCMARGIRTKWRFPLMYEFDMNMTLDKMKEVVTWVEEAGAECVANTCDMGNKTLLSDQGFDVTGGSHYIDHPVRPNEKFYIICDVPHLIKLFRNHILDSGADWTREDGSVTRVTKSCFEELLGKDSPEGELSKLYKITDDHLYCVGTARQRVKPAVQLLSSSVANAFCEAGELDKGELIQIIDDWFDVFDSRKQHHRSKQLKNGLGVHEEKQVAALNKMLNLMKNITFGGKLKPFMKGIVASTKSLLALWNDLKHRGWPHICTYNLNQDILELFFSNVRSLCGANDHPRANNFGSRFRILMLSSNCMKVLVDNANVAYAENDDEKEWSILRLEDGATEDFVEEANDGLVDLGDEGDLDRELADKTDEGALQYIIGFIARKCGLTTRAPEEGSWISRQSRAGCTVGLVRASDEMEEWVRLMDMKFNVLHRRMTLKTGANMLERTVNFILRRDECRDIPLKVVKLFVKVKFFHRLKCLNNRLKYAKRKRHRSVRDARKTAQFQN